MKKSKEDIIASLTSNIPQEMIQQNQLTDNNDQAGLVGPSNKEIIADSEEDFDFARARIKKLIDTTDEAIATLHNLATDAEHPRAFEVLSNLIKTAADMNSQLLSLTKDRKKIVQTPVPGTTGTNVTNTTTTNNNSIYVGTTADLQKFLKEREAIEI